MPRVVEVDLTDELVLPASKVGMVMLQPYLALTKVEPFKWVPNDKPRQLEAITRTLELALLADHGAGVTHFTLIPEYAIPGLDGVAVIDARLRTDEWPKNSVVIGGIDALSRAEYAQLCAEPGTHFDGTVNSPDNISEGSWINCCVTWVKCLDGTLRKWVQPKMCPAWPEQTAQYVQMSRGRSVFLFNCRFTNGATCRFLSLICYDFVGHEGEESILRGVLTWINQSRGGDQVSLNWLFVVENNDHPSHPTFLAAVHDLLIAQNEFPSVRRSNTCVVFANTAGGRGPGRVKDHGGSALIFSPTAAVDLGKDCRATYTGRATLLRHSEQIARCKDALFREYGACIHSFSQSIPDFLTLDASGRILPIQKAVVHGIAGSGGDDLRTAGKQVPGCVKWFNDYLDEAGCMIGHYANGAVASATSTVHQANVSELRVVEGSEVDRRVRDAYCPPEDAAVRDADEWATAETLACETMLQTLNIARLAFASLSVVDSTAHGTFIVGTSVVDIRVARGESHDESRKHLLERSVGPTRHRVLLVTRDRDNRARLSKEKKVYAPMRNVGDVAITDPESGITHIGFADLLDVLATAQNTKELTDALNANIFD